MVKKNDQIQLNITSVTSEGAGVGKLDNFTIFVANTAPGDLVLAHVIKVNKTYAIAKLLKIITPSDKRIENTCSVFLKCGGCCFRHIDYKEELNLKQQMVTQNLKKLGNINFQCEKINSFNFQRYRNKAQYPIGQDENGNLFAGFYATHSHRVIECQDCLLQPEIFNNITLDTLSFLQQNGVNAFNLEDFSNKKSSLIRHVFLRIGEITNEIMLCLVV
ncbi:MAG: TRAM domain-containing protein, partial [Oscillospiraceae bacterium]